MTATVYDLDMERFIREEGRWWAAVRSALDRHEDDETGHTMACPACGSTMDVCRRGSRMTYAGPEPACIQAYCCGCCLGGDM